MSSSQASEVKSIIVGLLTSNPLRCTVKQLCDDFLNTVGYSIPIRQLGFSNVEEYLRSIPDTVCVFGTGACAEVQGIIKPKSAHINLMVIKQKKDSIPSHKRRHLKKFPLSVSHANNLSNERRGSNFWVNEDTVIVRTAENSNHERSRLSSVCDEGYKSRVPPHIQNNLLKLILQFPDGIWCTNLPKEYQKMFRSKLDYEKYRYRSLIDMCADLSQIFHYVQPTSDDFVLYHKNNPVPSFNQNDTTCDSVEKDILEKFAKLTTNVSQTLVGTDLVPRDIVYWSDVIPRYFSNDWKIQDYLDIAVGEIYNFSKFWIYCTYGDLAPMMDELQIFFREQHNRYSIPNIFLEEGLYCAVLHLGKYYRCTIVDLLPKLCGYVRVLFIDYGSVGDVCVKDVCYLPIQFKDIPSQAIKAKLSNISFTDEHESTKNFIKLVTNRVLVGEIMNINRKDKILDIYLADTTDENNIFYINDLLVERGYASYVPS